MLKVYVRFLAAMKILYKFTNILILMNYAYLSTTGKQRCIQGVYAKERSVSKTLTHFSLYLHLPRPSHIDTPVSRYRSMFTDSLSRFPTEALWEELRIRKPHETPDDFIQSHTAVFLGVGS